MAYVDLNPITAYSATWLNTAAAIDGVNALTAYVSGLAMTHLIVYNCTGSAGAGWAPLPPDINITGIEVQVSAAVATGFTGTPTLLVELGGADIYFGKFGAAKYSSTLTSAVTLYSLGSSSDLWSYDFDRESIHGNSYFSVYVTPVGASGNIYKVDNIVIRIHYTEGDDGFRTRVPKWLTDIEYPADGVGDLNDLKFYPSVGAGGRWLGSINTGWFYHASLEQYNYALRGEKLIAAVSGTAITSGVGYTLMAPVSGTITDSVSFRPSWGPVLLTSVTKASGQLYNFHANSFYPGYSTSWNASGNYYYMALPASSILVGMRDSTNLGMGAVQGTNDLISERLYYYDYSASRVFTAASGNIYADLVYTYPQLRMREVVVQESEGVKPTYKNIEDINIIKAGQTAYVSGSVGNTYITHSLSGNVGDWVILDYLVRFSYIMPDHQSIVYFTSKTNSGDNFLVHYEQSIPEILDELVLTAPTTGQFNFNPLFANSYRAGYLYHAEPASSINNYYKPSKLGVYFDKNEVCTDYNETVNATITLLGENDLPIPHYPVDVAWTSPATAYATIPSSSMTDGRGEMHFTFCPGWPGPSTFTLSATASSLTSTVTGTDSVNIVGSADYITVDSWYQGMAHLVLTNEQTSTGKYKGYYTITSLDGVPRDWSGSVLDTEGNVIDSVTVPVRLDMKTGLQAIREFEYMPQKNVGLFVVGNTSKIYSPVQYNEEL